MAPKKSIILAPLATLFGRNWLTLLGGTIAGASAFLIIGCILVGLLGIANSPYIGIMAFMVLPGVFVGGLLLVPLGALWDHKYGSLGRVPETPFPVLDFNNAHTRHVVITVVVLTAFNLLIIGTVSYGGVEFMDSTEFCGKTCHTVMEPEYAAYSVSPHQRVACVECHIGPGAPWFVKAKISGLGQVIAVALHNYPTPIPSPVENLRPSRDTCEQCHWPEKFVGDRVKVITHYRDDETNTPAKTVLALHLGGGGQGKGIHSWHISPDKQTFYTAVDPQRQKMAKVRVVHKDGKESVYSAAKDAFTPEELAGAVERQMDCIDCHNRPSHIFKLPATEVDTAMEIGRIDATLPFIKKVGVETLTEAKGGENDLNLIEQKVRGFYTEKYPDLLKSTPERVDTAIAELQAIWKRNVFPKMGLTWGTHPNNLGHENFPGCFRCHDDKLQDAAEKPVGQDCEACHKVLAWDETDPEILQQLGL
jgi:nitrate/TMAO reductase-like tetraheme cytochrome c subunit